MEGIYVPLQQDYGVDTANIRRRLLAVQTSTGLELNGTHYKRRLLKDDTSYITPLFQGMGTHYSFMYVGTPAQRVSVIVDTGSHHTAFPCVGCKCGKHMDPYFDPRKSSTSVVKNCNGNQRCMFKQSYSEGSSWQAFRVKDTIWIGAHSVQEISSASAYAVNFEFGCQTSETGLFRTQHVDGIMGFSSMADTLPHQLVLQNKATTKLFAMCFRIGGGALTLGGADASLHKPNVAIKYAALIKSSGWFTVRLIDVLIKDPRSGKMKSIGENPGKYNSGKGTIVDSGTTDTYLPAAVRAAFQAGFNAVSGQFKYSNGKVMLSDEELSSLPTIVYRIAGKTTDYIDVECPPASYAELLKPDKSSAVESRRPYAFRIYLSEGSGAVLGANFMNNHNVLFDIDNGRIGFAESDCESGSSGFKPNNLEQHESLITADGKLRSDANAGEAGELVALDFHTKATQCFPKLVSPCDANCESGNITSKSRGYQKWENSHCVNPLLSWLPAVKEECFAICTKVGVQDGFEWTGCVNGTWSPCSSSCTQQRIVFLNPSKCQVGEVQTRECSVFECPIKLNEYVVGVNLHLNKGSSNTYSPYQTEDVLNAISQLISVKESSMHLFSVIGDHLGNKDLALKIRISYSSIENYNSSISLKSYSLGVYHFISSADFAETLTSMINGNSVNSGRRKWLRSNDLSVRLSSLSLAGVNGLKIIQESRLNPGRHGTAIANISSTDLHSSRLFAYSSSGQLWGILILICIIVYFFGRLRPRRTDTGHSNSRERFYITSV